MLHNVGKTDRIIRLVMAAIMAVIYFMHINNGVWDSYFMVGAAILLITASRRCCPLYAILGFGTCGVDTTQQTPIIKTKKIKLK